MKRIFLPLKNLSVYDYMHQLQPDGSFIVDEEKDGQSTEKHIEGIEYIKKVLQKGAKITPILAVEHEDGTYTRLDGFKRCLAHMELGYDNVEAFVVSEEELRRNEKFPYRDHYMQAVKGGQPKEYFSLFEGDEKEDFDYDKITFLYKSKDPHGLHIEVCENIQIHWGEFGRYRLAMGRRDFIQLAEAISKIDG